VPARKIVTGQKISAEKLERAKQLRREMTSAEVMLWQELQGNRLGVHFRRQQLIQGFIVDFYCDSVGLAIELDGDIHEEVGQKQTDARRDQILGAMGLRIVRFKNRAVTADLHEILAEIRALIQRGT